MLQYSKGAEEIIDLEALVDQVLGNKVENEKAKAELSKQQCLKLGAPQLPQAGVREPKLEAIAHETELKPGDIVKLESPWKKLKKDLTYKVISVKRNIVTAQREGSDDQVVFPKQMIDKILRSDK